MDKFNVDEITFLEELKREEIEKIKAMKQPVVRVCGPLTSDGPEGYAGNARRLEQAVEILKSKGMSVWSVNGGEQKIKERQCSHSSVCNYFHGPILESGLIQKAYFLPHWEESKGALFERETAEKVGIIIQEFPEEWFTHNV